jgi:hypothetical protein
MDKETTAIRKHTIENILHKQDDLYRWGFNEKQARERPEYLYYSPNFKSTLWTLLLLADIKAPGDIPQIKSSILLILITGFSVFQERAIFLFPA